MDIIFKEPFNSELEKLKVKTKFIKEFKLYCSRCNYNIVERLEYLNSCTNFTQFIASAFTFYNTKDGFAYWYNLMKR